MTILKNDRILRALLRQPVDYTPVWLMRQAGRYLPEYRATRAKAGSFMSLCKTPELACEVTLQPLVRYDLDAAILFSDILTIPDAMGLGLHFTEGEGPKFKKPVRDIQTIERLGVPDPESDLRYVMDAVRLIKHELAGRVPLLGFAGSPWTLATYMVEGESSKDFNLIRGMLYREPQMLHTLLERLTQAVIAYLNAQITAGVDAVMVFDTWGGILSTPAYQEFSLRYMQRIVEGVKQFTRTQTVPIILFTKNGAQWLELIAATGCDALGVDWTIDIGKAQQRVGDKVALQGNLDPAALFASPESIREQVQNILADFGNNNGHIFNLGHGLLKETPPENVGVFIDAVHELSKAFH